MSQVLSEEVYLPTEIERAEGIYEHWLEYVENNGRKPMEFNRYFYVGDPVVEPFNSNVLHGLFAKMLLIPSYLSDPDNPSTLSAAALEQESQRARPLIVANVGFVGLQRTVKPCYMIDGSTPTSFGLQYDGIIL